MLVSSYNQIGGGGINNQKMAIMGALMNAREKGIPFSVPLISEMDQVNGNYEKYGFDVLFHRQGIEEFCRRHAIGMVEYDEGNEFDESYEAFFWKTFHILESDPFSGPDGMRDIFVDLINIFMPKISGSDLFARLSEAIGNRVGEVASCQFRIERDWIVHCRNELSKTASDCDELYVGYDAILYKIRNTFPDLRNLFICVDEPAMPVVKDVIKKRSAEYGIHSMFKSDFIGPSEYDALRPNERSLLDMELCINHSRFIGNTKSTFSNMVSVQRFCRNGTDDRDHIYNHRSMFLRRRLDRGVSISATNSVAFMDNEVLFRNGLILIDRDTNASLFDIRPGTRLVAQDITDGGDVLCLRNISFNGRDFHDGVFACAKEDVVRL
ncbi:O-fucosyltransferase family protein [Novacetimonas cocois]|nr:hypothetical protein [Novacetimonas cocois]